MSEDCEQIPRTVRVYRWRKRNRNGLRRQRKVKR